MSGTGHGQKQTPVLGELQAIRVESDNLADCREFGTQAGTVISLLRGEDVGLDICNREQSFKAYEGDWLVKVHGHALFRLTHEEFNQMYRTDTDEI